MTSKPKNHLFESHGDPEPAVGVSSVRITATAIDNPTAVIVDPATATQHTQRTFACSLRVCAIVIRILTVPIPTPFPYVSASVIDAQFISGFATHRVSCIARIISTPRYTTDVVRATEGIALALVTSTGRKLPLRFRGQTVAIGAPVHGNAPLQLVILLCVFTMSQSLLEVPA